METKFKIGDRVLTHSTPSVVKSKSDFFNPNKKLTICKIVKHNDCTVMFFEEQPIGIFEGNFSLIPKEKEEIWY